MNAGDDQAVAGVPVRAASGLITMARAPRSARATIEPGGSPVEDYSGEEMLLGRIKPGRVRESRRVVHIFQIDPGMRDAVTVTARCGEAVLAEDVQWLPSLTGMPCEYCVLTTFACP